MTTPQSLTPNDLALGLVQLVSVREMLSGLADGRIPAQMARPISGGLVMALDQITHVTDGVSLPESDLDQAVGHVRAVRDQLREIHDNAAALTEETVQAQATTAAERLGQAIDLTFPYATGGDPAQSPHRLVELPSMPIPADAENPMSWLGEAMQEHRQVEQDDDANELEPLSSQPHRPNLADLIDQVERIQAQRRHPAGQGVTVTDRQEVAAIVDGRPRHGILQVVEGQVVVVIN